MTKYTITIPITILISTSTMLVIALAVLAGAIALLWYIVRRDTVLKRLYEEQVQVRSRIRKHRRRHYFTVNLVDPDPPTRPARRVRTTHRTETGEAHR